MDFKLDARLDNDCYQLAESDSSVWLLLNNSYFPWLIIVPKTKIEELYLLPSEVQMQLQKETNLLAEFLKTNIACDKLNIASIGNIVKQMHIHIIARTESDLCWPGVVWGTAFKQEYKQQEILEIQKKLKQFCQDKIINDVKFASFQ